MQRNMIETPRFSRRIVLKSAVLAPSALLTIASSVACREDPEPDPTRVALIKEREKLQATATAQAGGSPAPDVPPGIDFMNRAVEFFGQGARKLAGMDQAPTDNQSTQLKAKEKDKRPTIAAPPSPRTVKSEAPKPAPTTAAAKPVEKQKVQSVTEQLKRLKPEELQRILLTNPFSQDKLPKGFVVESGPTPLLALAPNLYGMTAIDNLAVPFKPIGKVNFGLKDGKKSYNISYTVFPDSNAAKGAFDSISSQPNVPSIKDFDAPATILNTEDIITMPSSVAETAFTVSMGSIRVECVILLNNLLVNASNSESFSSQPVTGNLKTKEARDKELADQKKQIEQRIQEIISVQKSAIIPVAKSGVLHLQKITG